VKLLVLLEELQVGAAAFKAVCEGLGGCSNGNGVRTLQLDLVLDNERLSLGVDGLVELGRDGVVGGLVFDDQALVALHSLEDGGLIDGPIADVGPLLGRILVLFLLGVRWLPPRVPIVGELLKETSLDLERGGLAERSAGCTCVLDWKRTVKVGFWMTVEDEELAAAEDEASATGSLTSSAACAETNAAPSAAANSRGRMAAMGERQSREQRQQ
jgi:hypothetical protein